MPDELFLCTDGPLDGQWLPDNGQGEILVTEPGLSRLTFSDAEVLTEPAKAPLRYVLSECKERGYNEAGEEVHFVVNRWLLAQ